ncbi:MAG: hypothetical protein ACREP9_16650, partial [Candidatus Dormibacteraceae bacterium]
DVHVLVNGSSFLDGLILSSTDVVPLSGKFALNAGDTVEFLVGFGPNATSLDDSTGIQVTMSVVPEASNLLAGALPALLLCYQGVRSVRWRGGRTQAC